MQRILRNPDFWILLATVVLCAAALPNAFVLDDGSKIVGNPDIRSLWNLPTRLIYAYEPTPILERNDPSRPLVFAIYTLLYALAGASPWIFHAFNLIAHAGCGFLVWRLTRQWMQAHGRDDLFAPAVATGLFLAAPLQTGTVFYAYGTSDLLAAFFAFLCVWLWAGPGGERGQSWPLRSLAVFASALCCKQSAVVIPALLVVWDLSTRAWSTREAWKRYRSFVALILFYLVTRATYFGGIGDLEGRGNLPPALAYAATQPWALLKYLSLAMWPFGRLAIDHFVLYTQFSAPAVLAYLALLLGLAAAVGAFWKAQRGHLIGDAVVLCALWYLICFAPTGSLLPAVDVFVERRVYGANFGWAFAFALALSEWRVLAQPWAGRALRVWIASGVLIVFGAASITRAVRHRTNEGVWSETLALYPDSPRALNNLANWKLAQGDFNAARNILESLAHQRPQDAYALSNLGAVYQEPRAPFYDVHKAADLFRRSLEIDPGFVESLYNLGRLEHMAGRVSSAESYYLRALAQKPSHVPALNNLAMIRMDQGQLFEARQLLNKARALDPNYPPAAENMRLLSVREEMAVNGGQAAPPLSTAPNGLPPGTHEVPIESVPLELIIDTYEKHLLKHPNDRAARAKYLEFCRARKLPCANKKH